MANTRVRNAAKPIVSFAASSRQTGDRFRSEEHTSELQSHLNLVCRLLLEKKKILPSLTAAHILTFCLEIAGTQTPPRSALANRSTNLQTIGRLADVAGAPPCRRGTALPTR